MIGVTFGFMGKQLIMPVACQYTHASCVSRSDGEPTTDIVCKMACIKSAYGKLKKHVLCSPQIPTDIMLSVAATHVFPTGEYAAGGWAQLSSVDESKVTRAITDVYRGIA